MDTEGIPFDRKQALETAKRLVKILDDTEGVGTYMWLMTVASIFDELRMELNIKTYGYKSEE